MRLFLDLALYAGLAVSAYTDVKTRRIKNFVTFPLMLLGLLGYAFLGGIHGMLVSLAGIGVATLVYLPFAIFGGMGMGDVKLLLAVGAIKGPLFALDVAAFAVAISLAWTLVASPRQAWRAVRNVGALFLSWILTRAVLRQPPETSAKLLAYAVFIGLGVVGASLSGGDLVWRFLH